MMTFTVYSVTYRDSGLNTLEEQFMEKLLTTYYENF